MFEQAGVTERVITAAGFVVQNSGNQPDNCVNDQHGGYFTAIADKITNGNLQRLQALSDPIIEPFVPPAQEQQSGFT